MPRRHCRRQASHEDRAHEGLGREKRRRVDQLDHQRQEQDACLQRQAQAGRDQGPRLRDQGAEVSTSVLHRSRSHCASASLFWSRFGTFSWAISHGRTESCIICPDARAHFSCPVGHWVITRSSLSNPFPSVTYTETVTCANMVLQPTRWFPLWLADCIAVKVVRFPQIDHA